MPTLRSPLSPPLQPALSSPLAVGALSRGAAPSPPTYTPSLDFSDPRNSQYIALILADD